MTRLDPTTTALRAPHGDFSLDEAELAAVAFLARYSNRTLDAYRHDLRSFFQWAADVGLRVMDATRPHIELYRAALEARGLAASTIDRRLSTVCGYYRFAHIDGRIAANPAQYVRRPKVSPSEGRGMDRGELGTFLFTAERVDRDHAAFAVLLGLNGLRVSEACATNIEDLSFERGHPHMLRAAFIMAALDAGVPLRDVQIAARHADPRTTTIYDRRRENLPAGVASFGAADATPPLPLRPQPVPHRPAGSR